MQMNNYFHSELLFRYPKHFPELNFNVVYRNFIPVIKQCHPVKPAEVLLKGFEDVGIYIEEQKTYGKQDCKTWGLFCASIESCNDAFHTREWVLQHNKR
jgi:hypothetical protein